MQKYSVLGCGIYTPHFNDAAAWLQGTPSPTEIPASGDVLDRRSRRISSELMRALVQVAHQAATQANADLSIIPSVYGAALGEVQTMVSLLDQIWVENEAPSPMAFAASVHNAAAGVASISFKNQGFTTSVAANFDTPAMSLFEGAALLETGCPHVLIVCGDEASPDRLMNHYPTWKTACAAVVLSANAADKNRIATITLPTRSDERIPLDSALEEQPASLQNNPCFGMVALVDAILHQRHGQVMLDAGRGRGWCTDVGS